MNTEPLALAYSTCPNDTFIFNALAQKAINTRGLDFCHRLEDVETLNQAAKTGTHPITKLSFAAVGHLAGRYRILRSGGALGRGCGPLIVARPGFDAGRLAGTRIAVPGAWTTATLLLGLFLGRPPAISAMPFDQIMPAVADGRFDAGVIIHEGRFTFGRFGLASLKDLGAWWEDETGLPIPLGAIAARSDLPEATVRTVEDLIEASVRHAFAHREAAMPYVRSHAQEMSDAVISQHIDLYVNDFSVDLGSEGRAAAQTLFGMGEKMGILPAGAGALDG